MSEKRVVYDFPGITRSPCPMGGVITVRRYSDQSIMLCSLGGASSKRSVKCGCGISQACYGNHSPQKLRREKISQLLGIIQGDILQRQISSSNLEN